MAFRNVLLPPIFKKNFPDHIGIVAAIPWFAQIILNNKEVSVAKDVHMIDHIKTMKWKKKRMLALLFGLGGMLTMYTVLYWLPTYLMNNGFTSETAGTILFCIIR